MTETTPEPAETRAVVRYVGADPVTLPDSARAVPGLITEGALVSLEVEAAGILAETDPRFERVVGKELDALVKAAGLPTGGTADEKRQRLADAEVARLAELDAAEAAATTDPADPAPGNDDTTGSDA